MTGSSGPYTQWKCGWGAFNIYFEYFYLWYTESRLPFCKAGYNKCFLCQMTISKQCDNVNGVSHSDEP